MNLTREIIFTPAYDKRDFHSKKNYGIHGVEMRCYVKGDKGVIQFVLYTNWQLPHVAEELEYKSNIVNKPLPADLGYHSYVAMYEGQTSLMKECPILNNKPCYYDGSGLNAKRVFNILVTEGSEAMWLYLENYYNETFENK